MFNFFLFNTTEAYYEKQERGQFASYRKYLTGVSLYPSNSPKSQIWEPRAIPMTWRGESPNPQTGTQAVTDNWVAVQNLIPGLTYYYRYTADYIVDGATVTVWDQRQGDRVVYVPIIFQLPALATSVTDYYYLVSDNWGDNPEAPRSLNALGGNNEVNLFWQPPVYRDNQVLDLTGGGYLVYVSTDGVNWTVTNGTGSLITGNTAKITGLTNGLTHYFKLRSVDAYTFDVLVATATKYPNDKDGASAWNYSETVAVLPGRMIDVTFFLDTSVLKNSTTERFYISGDVFDGWKYKLPLSRSGDSLYSYRAILPEKTKLSYKYIRETEYEKIYSASGNREYVIEDNDADSRLEINDAYGAFNYADRLPDDFSKLVFVPKNDSVEIAWDLSQGGAGYTLARSSFSPAAPGDYTIVSGTSALAQNGQVADAGLLQAVTYFYVVKNAAGDKILSGIFAVSPSGKIGRYPEFNPDSSLNSVKKMGNYYENQTGRMSLSFEPPQDTGYGRPDLYYVAISTFALTPVMLASTQVFNASLDHVRFVKKTKKSEDIVLSDFPDTCPGYFFYVLSYFGGYGKCSVSTPHVFVFGKRLDEEGGEVKKGNGGFGATVDLTSARLSVPAYSMPVNPAVFVIKNSLEIVSDSDSGLGAKIATANGKISLDKAVKAVSLNDSPQTSLIYSFEAYRPNGVKMYADSDADGRPDEQNKKSYTIEIPVKDANGDGILDGTEASGGIKITDLKLYRLNEKNGFWQYVDDGKLNGFDVNKFAVTCEVRHLSTYAVFSSAGWASDLSEVKVYPNPFKPYDGIASNGTEESQIVFANLTKNAKIYIYDISGDMVRIVDSVEGANLPAGKYRWDAKDENGEYLSSGVYIFYIKDDSVSSNNKFRGKIAIIR